MYRILALALLPVAAASAQAEPAVAPRGFVAFCMAHREICAASPPAVVHLTPDRMATLTLVNRAANHRYRPAPQAAWAYPTTAADCNGYALAKWRELAALRLAAVRTVAGEGHLVLVVATDAGPRVLDNLTADAVPAAALPYTWLAIQAAGDRAQWSQLNSPPK